MPNTIIEILRKEGLTTEMLWNLADYLLLAEESAAGKQDDTWEKRWQTLKGKGIGYVNILYRNKLENKVSSSMLLTYLTT